MFGFGFWVFCGSGGFVLFSASPASLLLTCHPVPSASSEEKQEIILWLVHILRLQCRLTVIPEHKQRISVAGLDVLGPFKSGLPDHCDRSPGVSQHLLSVLLFGH